MGAKRRFKVLAGQHWEGDRKYTEGQIVESEKPLDKMFVNKFTSADAQPTDPAAEVDPSQTKIVVDGGRTGPSTVPVNESSTTRSAGEHAASEEWSDERNDAGIPKTRQQQEGPEGSVGSSEEETGKTPKQPAALSKKR